MGWTGEGAGCDGWTYVFADGFGSVAVAGDGCDNSLATVLVFDTADELSEDHGVSLILILRRAEEHGAQLPFFPGSLFWEAEDQSTPTKL